MAAHKTFRLERVLDERTPRSQLHALLHNSADYFNRVIVQHNHAGNQVNDGGNNRRVYGRQSQLSVECHEEDIDSRTLAGLLADWAIISSEELKQGIDILADRRLSEKNGDESKERIFDFRVKKARESYGHVVVACSIYDGFRISEERITEYCPVTGAWMY